MEEYKSEDRQHYVCPDCDFKTKVLIRLTRHLNARNLVDKFKCDNCNITSCTKIGLQIHKKRFCLPQQRSMEDQSRFSCDFCHYKTSIRFALARHIESKHPGDVSADEIENNNDDMESEVEESYDLDEIPDLDEEPPAQENSLKCRFCDYVAKSNKALSCHLRSNKGLIHPCLDCGFKSCTKSVLAGHQESEHGMTRVSSNVRYSCEFCDYETFEQKYFQLHLQYRSTEPITEILTCDTCFTRLCTKKALSKHLRIKHKKLANKKKKVSRWSEGNLKLKCNKCSFTTLWNHSLKRHKIMKHSPNKDEIEAPKTIEEPKIKESHFQCDQCSFSSNYPHNLKRHQQSMHHSLPSIPKSYEKVYYVLPKPKKGKWLVMLEHLPGY